MQESIKTYLSLGSNVGNRFDHLEKALARLNNEVGITLVISHVYETEAWGKTDQPSFLNQIVGISTTKKPQDLLKVLQEIEDSMGRERKIKWGPRTLDLDILFYNDQIINELGLVIPHPEIQNRRFILKPLNEVAPELIHPIIGKSIEELYKSCSDTSSANLYFP